MSTCSLQRWTHIHYLTFPSLIVVKSNWIPSYFSTSHSYLLHLQHAHLISNSSFLIISIIRIDLPSNVIWYTNLRPMKCLVFTEDISYSCFRIQEQWLHIHICLKWLAQIMPCLIGIWFLFLRYCIIFPLMSS